MTSLGNLLTGFTTYAWRLEALDTYDVDGEREQYEDFLAGRHPQPSVDDVAWQAQARAIVASGRSIGRVRMVGHPITDYTRFEWAAYPDNVAAGEAVRVYDRRWPGGIDKRFEQDFWLFDDRVAAVMRYAVGGQFLGVELTEDVARYQETRRLALERSVPFNEYALPSISKENSTGAD